MPVFIVFSLLQFKTMRAIINYKCTLTDLWFTYGVVDEIGLFKQSFLFNIENKLSQGDSFAPIAQFFYSYFIIPALTCSKQPYVRSMNILTTMSFYYLHPTVCVGCSICIVHTHDPETYRCCSQVDYKGFESHCSSHRAEYQHLDITGILCFHASVTFHYK